MLKGGTNLVARLNYSLFNTPEDATAALCDGPFISQIQIAKTEYPDALFTQTSKPQRRNTATLKMKSIIVLLREQHSHLFPRTGPRPEYVQHLGQLLTGVSLDLSVQAAASDMSPSRRGSAMLRGAQGNSW